VIVFKKDNTCYYVLHGLSRLIELNVIAKINNISIYIYIYLFHSTLLQGHIYIYIY